MRKNFIVLFLLIHIAVSGQKAKNPFQRVNVPDSIALSLENAYNTKNVNAGKNVFNLINRKNFKFVNGVFSFQGQGAHFSRRIFIFNNKKIYIFKDDGASNPKGILKEYLDAVDYLNLNDNQMVQYLEAISVYLKDELGNTYGDEIQR
ncbi:hypothetical protein [Flavobacterium sp. N3904]|uniref:hypothetical protein n=1 Tax=Flavobacterium sp. N3904 TaxID=2986835 RepID=UPI0022250E9F|nr:hypothetical protein [Flavobacterium sp. N3904]